MMDDVYAGQMSGRRVEMMQDRVMNRYDADGSGDISIAEAGDFGRLARNFTKIDANDDGILTGSEIGNHIADRMERRAERMMMSERMNAVSAWMDMQEEQKVAAFDGIDTDGNGTLTEAELTAAADTARAAEEAARLREEKIAEINRMDLDGDGRLSANELQAELDARMAAQNVATFDGLDTDGDGMLSDAELAAGLAAQMPPADTEAPDVAMADPTPPEAPATPGAATPDPAETAGGAEMAPATSVAEAMDEQPDALSLIENVFVDMLEDNGQSVSTASLASMSQSLYAQAQDILINQLEMAVESLGESENQDDDQAISA